MDHATASRRRLAFVGVVCAVLGQAAQADEPPRNSIQLGAARAMFNVDAGDMTGPAGTTPPGIKTNVLDKNVLAMIYERRIAGPWSLTLQGGLPPVLTLVGAGAASAMGKIGTVRAWFPALMATYAWEPGPGWAVHAGAGLNYTFFTDGATNTTYDGGFGGTSSRAKFSPSLGPIVKLGVTRDIDRNWFVDLSYSRYWIKTTANVYTETPGAGTVQRKITARADPDVVSFTVGYRY